MVMGFPIRREKKRIWFLVVHHLVEDRDWRIRIGG